MAYEYRPRGVCSQGITFELEDGVVRNVCFTGGCSGNTQGVARLVDGMPAAEGLKRLSGSRCGIKPPSCPDQLARAIKQAMQQAEGRR